MPAVCQSSAFNPQSSKEDCILILFFVYLFWCFFFFLSQGFFYVDLSVLELALKTWLLFIIFESKSYSLVQAGLELVAILLLHSASQVKIWQV